MNRWQRIRSVLAGLCMITGALIIALSGEDGMLLVAAILGIGLMIRGIRTLLYYLTMARNTVGGKTMLVIGLVYMDLGALVWSLLDEAFVFIIIYLAGCYAFAGLVHILRGREEKKYGSAKWYRRVLYGLSNILIAAICLALIGKPLIPVYIYCAGLVYSGIVRILAAFRQTQIVYIQ